MRIEQGYRPANRWLERPLDERWRRFLWRCVAGSIVVGISMAAFVGPRQTVMRMRYEIAVLSQEVERLEREHHRLALEREALTAPEELHRQAGSLGLAVVPRERVFYLAGDGRLVRPPATPMPAPARAAARGGR